MFYFWHLQWGRALKFNPIMTRKIEIKKFSINWINLLTELNYLIIIRLFTLLKTYWGHRFPHWREFKPIRGRLSRNILSKSHAAGIRKISTRKFRKFLKNWIISQVMDFCDLKFLKFSMFCYMLKKTIKIFRLYT